jgi:hypothetical protein
MFCEECKDFGFVPVFDRHGVVVDTIECPCHMLEPNEYDWHLNNPGEPPPEVDPEERERIEVKSGRPDYQERYAT